MTAGEARQRVPMWRRLSVRLAAVFGVAMILFVQFEPVVTTEVARRFGVDLENVAIGVDPAELTDGACTVPAPVERAVARAGTEREGDGPALGAEIAAWDCFDNVAHVVTTFDLAIIATDLPGAFPIGSRLEVPEEIEVAASFYPIWFDPETSETGVERELRWLCLLPMNGPFSYVPDEVRDQFVGPGGTLPDGTLVVTSEQFNEEVERLMAIAKVVGWVLPVAVALLLGALVSWVVTRRLVRIMSAAANPSLDAFEHVDVRGKDEIGRLATGLAASRERIRTLLQEVEDKDAQRREWFAQVSHDLRTPLTALGACLDRAGPLAESLPPSETSERLAVTIQVARDDADRVHVLANDLLDAARMELPNALCLEEVPPVEVAERAVDLLSPIAEREGKRIELILEGEPGPVQADGHRLMRVFENLIRNGVHFAATTVTVTVTEEFDAARMTVTDDGPGFQGEGFDAEVADPRGRDRADSAGLGLVVVARILAAHGVDVEIDNCPEGGARISFVMPCIPETVGSDSGIHFRSAAG